MYEKKSDNSIRVAVSQQSDFSKETKYLAYLSPLFDAKIRKLTPSKKCEKKKNQDWVIWWLHPQGSRQEMIASKTLNSWNGTENI